VKRDVSGCAQPRDVSSVRRNLGFNECDRNHYDVNDRCRIMKRKFVMQEIE
jgi:hypothetical protein